MNTNEYPATVLYLIRFTAGGLLCKTHSIEGGPAINKNIGRNVKHITTELSIGKKLYALCYKFEFLLITVDLIFTKLLHY